MKYQIEAFAHNQNSIRDLEAGEQMHSSIGPWTEANLVYIQPSHLKERLLTPALSEAHIPLVIYDVGLGIAANALAAIDVFLNIQPSRDLHLISFENKISGIQFALEHIDDFPFLKTYEHLVLSLIQDRKMTLAQGGRTLHWELREGDFREQLSSCSPAEIIFYDFYSPKTCPELWGYQTFKLLFESTKKRRDDHRETTLYTYCSSTAARAAMMLAGFYVGHGPATPSKRETTIASTFIENLNRPLDLRWLEKWHRSAKPLPEDYPSQLLISLDASG